MQPCKDRWPWRRAVIGALTVVVLSVAATGRLLVFPQVDAPHQASLVVILGSVYRGDRVNLTRSTWRAASTTILASEPAHCPTLSIHKYSAATVICFVADPLTTRGEARFAANYAVAHHHTAITVVTTADQVARARVRFARCWTGPLSVVQADDPREDVLRHVPYQIAAFSKAMIWERGC